MSETSQEIKTAPNKCSSCTNNRLVGPNDQTSYYCFKVDEENPVKESCCWYTTKPYTRPYRELSHFDIRYGNQN